MKLRNILSILLVTFAVLSCSSESDILNDIPSQNVPTATTSEVAYIGVDVKSIAVQTKADAAAAATAPEQTITNAIFFLLEGDNVIGFGDNAAAKIFTKTRNGLKVYVIANITKTTLNEVKTLKTLSAINDVIFSAEDLKMLPKVGSAEVDFTKIKGSSSTTGEIPVCPVTVTVAQRNACIRLASCKVTGFNAGANDQVVLTKVAISNIKTQGYVGGTKDVADAFDTKNETVSCELWNEGGKVEGGSFKPVDFLSFRNTSETKTAMTLTFTVDGVEKSMTFDIKANEEAAQIENGCIYNVHVSVAVKGETIVPTITLTVADWTESKVNVDMEEKN